MEGEQVGDFEIKRIIGEGSLGPVYLAEHKFIKKIFALKFLPSMLLGDSSFRDHFIAEIAKIASLDHDNIVSVYNVSSFKDQLFIVSDYVPYKAPGSMNLGSYLSTCTERLKEAEVLQILKEVAFGLDYIHGQSMLSEPLVHGGVKLSNILLAETSDGGYKIKLSDTGIIPILGEGYVLEHMMKKLTSSLDDKAKAAHNKKAFMETFAFLSPEQRFSTEKELNFKSDTYSFGVLTYFLLMGFLPEGYFAMPSTVHKNSSIDWDMIIRSTLAQNRDERADNLTTLIKGAVGMTKLEEVVIPEKKSAYSYQTPISKPQVKVEEEKKVFAAAETPEEAKTMAYAKLKEEKAVIKNEERVQKEAGASIAQLERNLIGSLSKTSNVSPMRMQSSPQERSASTTMETPVEQEDPRAIFNKKNQVRAYKPEKVDTDGIKPLLTESIKIEEGEYERGSSVGARDEKPRHKVKLSTFSIDIHPVTNEQFLRFLLVMEGEKDGLNHDTILLKESRIKRIAGDMTIETGYLKHPAVGVSYYGAKAYAKWIGKRLPTEAEWEVSASMSNAKNIFPFGGEIERTQANFFSSDTTPVMSYPPSKNGLYDMVGNVYEWCEDWYDYGFYETSELEPDNPEGPAQGVYRVLRGGCWKSLVDDMRCSHRFRNNPGTMNRTYGFRCVSS